LKSRKMKMRRIKRRKRKTLRILCLPRRMKISLETVMMRIMTLTLMTFLSMKILLESHPNPMSSTMDTLPSFLKRKIN